MKNYELKFDEKFGLNYAEFKNGCKLYLARSEEERDKVDSELPLEFWGDAVYTKYSVININGRFKSENWWKRGKSCAKLKHFGYLKPYSILCNMHKLGTVAVENEYGQIICLSCRSKLSLNKKRLMKKFK